MLTGNPDAQLEELSSLHARRVVKVATALDPRQRYANAANMKDALLEQCQANTAASHAGTLDTIWNIWRIAATAVAAVLLIAFVAVGVGTGVPALAIAYMGVYLFCVGIPWLALTDAFGIVGRLGWFDGKRWATAVVLIMLSIAVLFVFVGIWMAVGLPWPSSTAGS